jgi:uncharacterized protein
MTDITQTIAAELSIKDSQVKAVVELIDGGSTVPFIARYRKEATGGLDDIALRALEARLIYLRELNDRRESILSSIQEQGKLTDALAGQLHNAVTKQALEDLYLPYKPKRRTKAQIAKEAGIEPFADALLTDPTQDPKVLAETYLNVDAGFAEVAAVMDGGRDILMERWSENPELVSALRDQLWESGFLQSEVLADQEKKGEKFADYFEYCENISKVPSHRALAVFRGRNEGVLSAKLVLAADSETLKRKQLLIEQQISENAGWQHQNRAADDWIGKAVQWTWKIKLQLSLERELFSQLKEQAEAAAIDVFGANIRDLLLAAPAGKKVVMGLDPGIRTGVKVAVVDSTGKLVDTATIYPHEPKRDWQGSAAKLAQLIKTHAVNLIAIGNGTASRETDKLAADVIKQLKTENDAAVVNKMVVSEAGASVYSASEYASLEMPDIDVSIRGAVSIARRLQDPLAELVKIEPKSIGVGQYQHDVNQVALAKQLDRVVEDCVNAVGVDLNTASAPLLERVSGLSKTVAQNIIRHRDENGAFVNRKQLRDVTGLGAKGFEQCAGFLRIRDGAEPLDQTTVHPESYPVVETILNNLDKSLEAVMGNAAELKKVAINDPIFGDVGEYTLQDILTELEKPGRDPRPDFVVASLKDGVEAIQDLKEAMQLEGTVTNVANFGAFVDIGVHQDGLVHISQLADIFVKDARDIVKTGDIVKVTVLEVDVPRKRISLSMKSNPEISGSKSGSKSESTGDTKKASATSSAKKYGTAKSAKQSKAPPAETAMAAAFAKLKK